MSKLKKAAILEQNESHTELIPAQIEYLITFNVKVYLVIFEEAFEKLSKKDLDKCDDVYVFKKEKGFRNHLKIGGNINSFLKKHKIENLVLNTASGKFVRNLLFKIPKRIHITGIIHHIDKIEKSFTQKYTSYKVNQYLKLGEHLKSKIQLKNFYPILPKSVESQENFAKTFLEIMIPGNIENKRRDYQGLIEILSANKNSLKKEVKFIIAGNSLKGDGLEFKNAIKEAQLESYFETFEGFIANQKFDELSARAHYIMPLLHPSISDFSKYYQNKISGSFNIAYSFRKPLLMHQAFSKIEEFKDISYFYNEKNLIETINNLPKNPSQITKEYNDNPKYSFDYQAESFFNTVIKKSA